MSRKQRRTSAGLPPRVAEWLATRPDVAREPYPWVVFSFASLEGLDTEDLTALGITLNHFTPELLAVELPDVSRGDLVAILAGWPWTADVRKQEVEAPEGAPEDEVIWWVEDLIELLGCATEQQLIEHVRDTLAPWVSTTWSTEECLRIDVLDYDRTSRLEFRYPFSLDTFRAALQFPFDEARYAWMSPLELKEYAVEIGYSGCVEDLDDLGVTVTDLVSWFVSRDIGSDEDDDEYDGEDLVVSDDEVTGDLEIWLGDDGVPGSSQCQAARHRPHRAVPTMTAPHRPTGMTGE
jgi:hypothetical protein